MQIVGVNQGDINDDRKVYKRNQRPQRKGKQPAKEGDID